MIVLTLRDQNSEIIQRRDCPNHLQCSVQFKSDFQHLDLQCPVHPFLHPHLTSSLHNGITLFFTLCQPHFGKHPNNPSLYTKTFVFVHFEDWRIDLKAILIVLVPLWSFRCSWSLSLIPEKENSSCLVHFFCVASFWISSKVYLRVPVWWCQGCIC